MIRDIKDIQNLLISGYSDWSSQGNVYIKEKGDLVLFNYTAKATFSKDWNFLEAASRGLILNKITGEVVARPFNKFFNYGQDGRYPTGAIKTVTEKMDGSLGILYRDNGIFRIATRGSFESEQAIWATNYLEQYNLIGLPSEMTLLFEIIYPGNRIVVDYGIREDLVLIGIRNRFTGEYYNRLQTEIIAYMYSFSLPRVYLFDTPDQLINACQELDGNSEGWVVEFEDGLFKFKGAQYMELHKLIAGLSFKNTLRYVADDNLEDLLLVAPDEFLGDITRWADEIKSRVDAVLFEIETAFDVAPKETRKAFAVWVIANHLTLAPYLFARLDNKPVKLLIYKKEF